MKKNLFLVSVFGILFSINSFAIEFIKDEFSFTAKANKAYQLNLRDLVKTAETTEPIVFSFNTLPEWLIYNKSETKIYGTPKTTNYNELFEVYVRQGNSHDVALFHISIEGLNSIAWVYEKLEFETCTGKSFMSGDISGSLIVKDPGTSLPIPPVKFELIGAPVWVKSIYKVPAGSDMSSYYLIGTPSKAGVVTFQIKATFKDDSAVVDAVLTVKDCRSF